MRVDPKLCIACSGCIVTRRDTDEEALYMDTERMVARTILKKCGGCGVCQYVMSSRNYKCYIKGGGRRKKNWKSRFYLSDYRSIMQSCMRIILILKNYIP